MKLSTESHSAVVCYAKNGLAIVFHDGKIYSQVDVDRDDMPRFAELGCEFIEEFTVPATCVRWPGFAACISPEEIEAHKDADEILTMIKMEGIDIAIAKWDRRHGRA